jgi:hypothetical protein
MPAILIEQCMYDHGHDTHNRYIIRSALALLISVYTCVNVERKKLENTDPELSRSELCG